MDLSYLRFLFLLSLFFGFTVSAATTKTVPPSTSVSSLSANEIAKALESSFVAVYEKVSPAVVVISVTRSPDRSDANEFNPEEQQPDLFDFFHRAPRRTPPLPHDSGESQGSGFIVRADGYIYTNNHVIQGADKIKVRLKDGRTFDGQIIGVPDEKTDVAVIKIDAKDLPTVEIGDSDAIRPGQWTIAIGAPFNLDYSLTAGPLSGKFRDRLGATLYEEYLQTQATINPGNSGGPLLNIDGKVIGISTLIKTRQGAGFNFYNANVGFAIPIKLAQKIGNLLITKGKVERPWIGVDIQTLEEATEVKNSLNGVNKGVLIDKIRPDTPAYQSGLKPLDVITAIDGVPVSTARDLQKQVLEKKIGQLIHLNIVRDGLPLSVDVKTGLQPSTQQVSVKTPPSPATQSYGITVQPITRELIEQFNLIEKQGLMIMDVDEDSAAARSGLTLGTVITEIDGKKVSTVQAFKDVLRKSDPKRGARIQISKDGVRTFVILRLVPTSE